MVDYLETLNAAKRELEEIRAKRMELDSREAGLEEVIAALSRLCADRPVIPELAQQGITSAIRFIFELATEPLTPIEVKEWLKDAGYDLEGYSNAMATIHTTLNRMAEPGGEIEATEKDGKKAFKAKQHRITATFTANYESRGPKVEMFKGVVPLPGPLSPSLTKKQGTEAFKRGLKELRGLTGEAREAKQKEVLGIRKAINKKK